MITENLSSGTKCIPETVVISVPKSKDALLKCIEFNNYYTKKYINSLRSSLRGDSSNVLCKDDEIITYMYINPVNKSFYELVKKKSTDSNPLLFKLINSYQDDLLSPVELKNEGWRIEKVLVKSEVINTSCRNTSQGNLQIDENYSIMVLSHPEMRNTIYSKFGYDINEYPNLCTVIVVDNHFLNDYLNTFNKSFVYGNSFDTIRIVDNVVMDKTCPGLYISAKTEFIPEDYYKDNANTKKLDYAIKLGNIESNLVSLNNKYIPGHIYRFQSNSNSFELLTSSYYHRNKPNYLLYVGRIDLARYISTSHYRLTIHGLFTDIYDMSELNGWSRDIKNLTKLSGSDAGYNCTSVNMCLNTPVDVFTIVVADIYNEEEVLLETQKSEDEYIDTLADKFNTSTNTNTDKSIPRARFVVLPAIELTNNKRGHSLEMEVTPDSEKDRMKKDSLNDKDLPTSYRIYQEVVDLGKYVDIISPTKLFMKKVILNIEGKNEKNTYDLLKDLTKKVSSGGWGYIGSGTINLDSYNLFTKEELQSLDKETFNNLRSNLMDLIIKVLYAYCTIYAQSCFCNTYRKSFTMNAFSPKFSDIKEGFLMRLQNSIHAFWTGQKDKSHSIISSSSFRFFIEDIIITELGKGKQEGDLIYNATGIFDTLEKYCITEKDLRRCAEFLN